jgi:hypothetical protein
MSRVGLYCFICVILLIVVGLFTHIIQNPLRVPVAHNQMLLHVISNQERSRFTCPLSDRQTLVLALPAGTLETQRLDAKIWIRCSNTNVVVLPVVNATITRCNWLRDDKLEAYIIENTTATDRWNLSLESGAEYNIIVDGAPDRAVIWLHYICPAGWKLGHSVRNQ